MKLTVISAQRHIIEQRNPYVKLRLELPEDLRSDLVRSGFVQMRIDDAEFTKQFGNRPVNEVRGLEFEL